MSDSAYAPGTGDLDPSQFRRIGHDAIEAMAEYQERLNVLPVLPRVTPHQVAALFQERLPEHGESAGTLLADWRDRVSPLLTAVGSPRHFAYVNGSGARIGILADALAACTNTNAGAWKLGPAAVEIERQSLRWLAQFVGYPEDAGGIFVSGGTLANFTAILTALRHAAPYDSTPDGLQDPARTGRFLLYVSDHEGHVSVTRVADMLNLGRRAVRRVPSRSDFTIDADALDSMLTEDRRRGDLPFCVIAQLGSVNVGAIDPLDRLADVCAAHRVWLHGDGACGLLAAGLPHMRRWFRGIERADSVSVDAHKLLGVPYDCGVVFVRDAERLRRAFSIAAPYLRSTLSTDDQGFDFLEYGPEMSRGFRALKVWMVLRMLGADGLRALVARSLELTQHLHRLVADHPDFEVVHEPHLYLYCFRCVPHALANHSSGADAELAIDRLNQAIADDIQQSGRALVMTTRIRGRITLRMSVCSQRTTQADIDGTFEAIAEAARRLATTLSVTHHRIEENQSC